MKNKKRFFCLCVFIGLFAECSKDGANPALADTFIPNVSFVWKELKGRNTSSSFIPALTDHDDKAGTGNFTFTEQGPGGSFFYNLKGSYNREQVQIHYLTTAENLGVKNGPDSGLTFKGVFDTTDARNNHAIMRLIKTSNNTDSLVLRQTP